jgi:mono/diheme cytochrome c family protein
LKAVSLWHSAAVMVWCGAAAAATPWSGPPVRTPIVQSETRSVWDGVFTEAQAARGQAAYADACTTCHRDDLGGNEDGAPPLAGAAFFKRWTGRPLSEFSFVLAETMPQDAPRSLTASQYTDVIAFILERNGASAGKTELPDEADRLGRIMITPPPRLCR